MKDKLEFYINGQWVESESDERIEVENPATEQVIVMFLRELKEI